jgi:hypothetical protein
MPRFDDKQKFGREDETRSSSPEESPDDEMEDWDRDQSEDGSAGDEIREVTAADWKKEFPDYSDEEFAEKIPDRGPSRWMPLVVSCLYGLLLGAAIAGVIVNNLPAPRQALMFFVYLLVLAPVVTFAWHWLFYLRSNRLKKKMDNQGANPVGSEPIHPK